MSYYPPSILNLIKHIARLPGIGEKTAERLALHILRSPRAEVEKLSNSIITAKENIRLCKTCFGLSDDEICQICANPARDDALLCVVEQPADMVAMEKSGEGAGQVQQQRHSGIQAVSHLSPDQAERDFVETFLYEVPEATAGRVATQLPGAIAQKRNRPVSEKDRATMTVYKGVATVRTNPGGCIRGVP